MHSHPKALLLDFGGVIVLTHKTPERLPQLAAEMAEHAGVEAGLMEKSLRTGVGAIKSFKHAASRRQAPAELGHREVIVDFLAADLPAGPRELLAADAEHWVARRTRLLSGATVREGIPGLLEYCRTHGIALGVVSNALSGRVHREILAEAGIDHYFGVQVYSDEVGIRKPNPRMITLAADALGVEAGECWYVGDTLDRDVVAGRRAGVGGLFITRSQHSDEVPFAIDERPDAVFDSPVGLLEELKVAGVGKHPAAGEGCGDSALLIDHGGVISESEPSPEGRAEFLARLSALLGDAATAERVLERGLAAHKRLKAMRRELGDYTDTGMHRFWAQATRGESPRVRALVAANASELMRAWALAKSRRVLRPGVRELFDYCEATGRRVVVVTNTVSGQAVREIIAAHGLSPHATVASDEIGVRKPDPAIVAAALAVSGADPAHTWFLGDKPANDAVGALALGISRRVLVRYGPAGTDLAVRQDTALADGTATDLIDTPGQLVDLMQAADHTHPTATIRS